MKIQRIYRTYATLQSLTFQNCTVMKIFLPTMWTAMDLSFTLSTYTLHCLHLLPCCPLRHVLMMSMTWGGGSHIARVLAEHQLLTGYGHRLCSTLNLSFSHNLLHQLRPKTTLHYVNIDSRMLIGLLLQPEMYFVVSSLVCAMCTADKSCTVHCSLLSYWTVAPHYIYISSPPYTSFTLSWHIHCIRIWMTLDRNEIWAQDLYHSTALVEAAKKFRPSNVERCGKVPYQKPQLKSMA